jgi:hypothetical protein
VIVVSQEVRAARLVLAFHKHEQTPEEFVLLDQFVMIAEQKSVLPVQPIEDTHSLFEGHGAPEEIASVEGQMVWFVRDSLIVLLDEKLIVLFDVRKRALCEFEDPALSVVSAVSVVLVGRHKHVHLIRPFSRIRARQRQARLRISPPRRPLLQNKKA